jgi:hypothetical protein
MVGGRSATQVFERQLADARRRRVTLLPRDRPRRERAAKQQQLDLF